MPGTVQLAVEGHYLDVALSTWKEGMWQSMAATLGTDQPKVEVVSVKLEPGDIVFWRGDLMHRGAASQSADTRLLWHSYTPAMTMVNDELFNMFSSA